MANQYLFARPLCHFDWKLADGRLLYCALDKLQTASGYDVTIKLYHHHMIHTHTHRHTLATFARHALHSIECSSLELGSSSIVGLLQKLL